MNITLIGMPGAGKSTVGIVAAKLLNLNFIDTDLLIQMQEGLLLWQILAQKGNACFFAAEESVLTSLSCQNTLIATGGSAVYSEKGMAHLKNISKIVFLNPSLDEITRRVGSLSARGVAAKHATTLAEIYQERLPLYRAYADFVIDPKNQPLKDTAMQVANLFS